jgi:hypothetical protein
VLPDILGCLLQQLVQRQSNISEEIQGLYRSYRDGIDRPTAAELSTLLQFVSHSRSKNLVVIDALDECVDTDGTRYQLLCELQHLRPNLHLIITVQSHILDVEEEFSDVHCLNICAHKEDIKLYCGSGICEECGL